MVAGQQNRLVTSSTGAGSAAQEHQWKEVMQPRRQKEDRGRSTSRVEMSLQNKVQ